MHRVTQISAWLAIGLCIAAAPAIFASRRRRPDLGHQHRIRDWGAPPRGNSVLTDPAGDRTGPESREIHLSNPMSGLYNLRVSGRRTGTYLLILKAYTASGSTSDVRFPHMTIKPGEVRHYDVNFSAAGPKLDVRRTRVTTE